MRQILVGTSALLSFADRRDPDHERVVNSVRDASVPVVLTNYVFDETVTVTNARYGAKQAIALGERLRSSHFCQFVRIIPEDEEAAWQIFSAYADKDWSYTDCTSMAIMHRLGIVEAFALDHHFRQMGFTVFP